MRQYVELLLTCADEAEATEVTKALLDMHLIACAKRLPVQAKYWWEGDITDGNEVMLLMESAADLFDEVEVAVEKLHSYDTFVLQAISFLRISKAATTWLEENLKPLVVDA